jgi:hypothetical protein
MGISAMGPTKTSTTTATKPPPKPPTPVTAKPAAPSSKFSVLEYINRGDTSEQPNKSEETKPTVTRKRKRVSWANEGNLEQVKMIENITIEYADDLFWHPSQAIESARDLDIGEGHAFGKDLMEYDVEEEKEWYEPNRNLYLELSNVAFDFSVLPEAEERGIKRAGSKKPDAKDAETQKVREAGVLLVTYLSDGDIPDSPSEPFLEELVTSQHVVPPKIIPFPQELRVLKST